jgi:fermentation-respiration switch protein FrsA (DUF1100 family)
MILLLVGCMSMDSFFFNPETVSAYALQSDVIPTDQLEEVSFETADGVTLYGVWAHQLDVNAPVLLYFHGNYRHIDEYMPMVDDYWSWGYEVFIFDYRGFGKSEGTPDWEGLLIDGETAVAYFAETTGVPEGNFPYLGLSLGGTVSIQTAVNHPPSVLVTQDMFASGEQLINDGSGLDLPPEWLLEDSWDNTVAAAQLDVPYLIVHGANDTFVQPTHAETVYAAANEPKKLWLVPGADHAEAADVDPEGYAEQVGCWLAETCIE